MNTRDGQILVHIETANAGLLPRETFGTCGKVHCSILEHSCSMLTLSKLDMCTSTVRGCHWEHLSLRWVAFLYTNQYCNVPVDSTEIYFGVGEIKWAFQRSQIAVESPESSVVPLAPGTVMSTIEFAIDEIMNLMISIITEHKSPPQPFLGVFVVGSTASSTFVSLS